MFIYCLQENHGYSSSTDVNKEINNKFSIPKKKKILLVDDEPDITYTETKNKIKGLCKTFDELHPAVVPIQELFQHTSSNPSSNNHTLKKLNYQDIALYCRRLFKKLDSSK